MAAPINSLEWWDSYFEAQWEHNHGREQTRHFMSELLNYLPAREYQWISSAKRTILDWGCALGEGVDVLHFAFPASEVSGLDFSRTAIDKARAAYPRHRFLWAEDGSIRSDYDVIVTSNCLEHFPDPFAVAARHVEHARYLYLVLVPFEEPVPMAPSHVQRFTAGSFPDQIGHFRKLSLTVFRPLPRFWDAPQSIVCYASPDYAS
jgi:Methyltransferase domain